MLKVSILILLFFCHCKGGSEFLFKHWAHPLEDPHPKEHLNPTNCAGCHKTQYTAYRTSLHAKTMESGVIWQLAAMDPKERKNCYSCHAPFPVQHKTWNETLDLLKGKCISLAFGSEDSIQASCKQVKSSTPTDSVDSDFLKSSGIPLGITCATCHIRGKNFYGPPLSGNVAKDYLGARLHSLEIRKEFSDETFCISCHTTPRDGKRVHGKYLMDIYEDWKSTKFARQGDHFRTCQSCHMPGREHSWKGIHSKEFVEKAIQIEWDPSHESLQITNQGAGHKFPAYSVSRIEILLVDNWGNELYRNELGWKLDVFLEKEFKDTRIASGESRKIPIPLTERVHNLATHKDNLGKLQKDSFKKISDWKIQVFIHPRSHYADSFRYTLKNLTLTDWESFNLKNAIQSIEDSRYLLWEKNIGFDGYSKSRLE